MLAGILLCILPLWDQLSANKYYGAKCIPGSEILLPDGRCFCSPRGLIDLCVGLFEREDVVMRNQPGKKKIGRIVGGNSTSIDLYPYVVGLEKKGSLFCGATTIADDWAITAAHCVADSKCDEDEKCQIRAGSSKRQEEGYLFDVVEVIIHESYKTENTSNEYDLAVIRVDKPFKNASESLITVNLPDEDYEMPNGTMVTVLGWGRTKEKGDRATDLQGIEIPIVDNDACKNAYGSQLYSNMICAGYAEGGMDSCQGDSGGPMVINDTLVGVVSFGKGCARPDYPGVYTRVASFRDWIKDKAGV